MARKTKHLRLRQVRSRLPPSLPPVHRRRLAVRLPKQPAPQATNQLPNFQQLSYPLATGVSQVRKPLSSRHRGRRIRSRLTPPNNPEPIRVPIHSVQSPPICIKRRLQARSTADKPAAVRLQPISSPAIPQPQAQADAGSLGQAARWQPMDRPPIKEPRCHSISPTVRECRLDSEALRAYQAIRRAQLKALLPRRITQPVQLQPSPSQWPLLRLSLFCRQAPRLMLLRETRRSAKRLR